MFNSNTFFLCFFAVKVNYRLKCNNIGAGRWQQQPQRDARQSARLAPLHPTDTSNRPVTVLNHFFAQPPPKQRLKTAYLTYRTHTHTRPRLNRVSVDMIIILFALGICKPFW